MASTSLMTYLNYMSTWVTESDANINEIIAEQNLFLQVGDFESDTAVNEEFQTLTNVAISVRNQTIAADAVHIASDVAAVGSIWSFGLGMAAFSILQASELIERAFISNKSLELNNKLKTIDVDISAKISENVKSYITKFKANNNLIRAKIPQGLDPKTCRSILLQFIADVHKTAGKLDAATFKQYADSARMLFNSAEIIGVYDALDRLNLSAKNEDDVTAYFNYIVGLRLPFPAVIARRILMNVSVMIMLRHIHIANQTIKAAAIKAEEAARLTGETDVIAEEIAGRSTYEAMSAVGKALTGLGIMVSVVDTVLTVLDIVDVVQQSNAMCNELQGRIKQSYLDYFNGIKEASKQYKAALNITLPNNTWIKNPNVAQFKEADWSNLKKTIHNTTPEAAKLYANSDPTINFFFYCRQNVTLEPHGTFFPGTAVFFAGKPWYGVTDRCDAYDKSSS